MTSELANHLWQSTLFAVAVGLLTLMCRKNRAGVRYWLWFSASVKLFVPFGLLMMLGNQLQSALAPQQVASPGVVTTLSQASRPFIEEWALGAPAVHAASASYSWLGSAVIGIWLTGVVALGLTRYRMWRRLCAVVHNSSPWALPGLPLPAMIDIRSTSSLMEPGVVGFWRQVLLVPAGIENDLTPAQLQAVLAHELCQISRRDNLTAAIHIFAEVLFWFFPLVWWIGSRLVHERELACDETVLRECGEPQAYAEGILIVCKRYVETPLVCVAGVSGANLRRRIEVIMTNRVGVTLNARRRIALAAAAVAALSAPIVVGAIVIGEVGQAPLSSVAPPKFEVVSVKPCDKPLIGNRGGPPAPGRLHLGCDGIPVADRIEMAYMSGTGLRPSHQVVYGGPDWIRTDSYEISAVAEGTPSRPTMEGPMLRAILEDRFKLKIRREARERPVYALTIARGGHKLQPFRESAECAQYEPNNWPPTPRTPPCFVGKPIKPRVSGENTPMMWFGRKGPNRTVDVVPVSVDELAILLGSDLDRPIVNRTGLTGMFDVHFEFFPVGATAPDTPGAGATIFAALEEQLGLKLEATRGPYDVLVIDSIERPSEN